MPLRALPKIIQIILLLPIESILPSTNCRKEQSTSKFVPDQEVWLSVYCFIDHKTYVFQYISGVKVRVLRYLK